MLTKCCTAVTAAMIAVGLIACTSVLPEARADHISPQDSVLIVDVTWTGTVNYRSEGGEPLSKRTQVRRSCTAYVVGVAGEAITAHRCISSETGRARVINAFLSGEDQLNDEQLRRDWDVTMEKTIIYVTRPEGVEGTTGGPLRAEVVENPKGWGDNALLRVDGLPKDVPTLKLDPEASSRKVGDRLAVVGVVAGESEVVFREATIIADQPPLGSSGRADTAIRANVTEGMYGGPAVNYDDGLIGTVSYVPVGNRLLQVVTNREDLEALLKDGKIKSGR